MTKLLPVVVAIFSVGTAAYAKDDHVKQVPVLTFAQAEAMQAKAAEVMKKHNIGGVVVIVDASDQVISFHRHDGATLANIALAPKKAHTAVAFGRPSGAFGQQLAAGNMSFVGNPEVTPLPGGLPIMMNGTLVGAIGVSTPDGSVDLEVANGALAGL